MGHISTLLFWATCAVGEVCDTTSSRAAALNASCSCCVHQLCLTAVIFDHISPPPPGPIEQPWEFSISALIRRRYRVPAAAQKALDGLDRFGALRLRPESLGYDECDVGWTQLVEIQTRPLAEALSRTALDHELERARKLIPPIPGRKWLLQKLADELGALWHAAIVKRTDMSSKHVPLQLVYRASLGRTKVATGGMVVTATLAGIPATTDAILATAAAYSVPVIALETGGGQRTQ